MIAKEQLKEKEEASEDLDEKYELNGDPNSSCVCNMEWRSIKLDADESDCQCWD